MSSSMKKSGYLFFLKRGRYKVSHWNVDVSCCGQCGCVVCQSRARQAFVVSHSCSCDASTNIFSLTSLRVGSYIRNGKYPLWIHHDTLKIYSPYGPV